MFDKQTKLGVIIDIKKHYSGNQIPFRACTTFTDNIFFFTTGSSTHKKTI